MLRIRWPFSSSLSGCSGLVVLWFLLGLEILGAYGLAAQVIRPAVGQVNVIAVRVEFLADTTELTSGTGVFGPDGFGGLDYLAREHDTRIDPLPHNQQYFEAHLEFARNYYLKASDGQLELDYQVLPEVVQLDNPMSFYSPIGEEFTLEKLAILLEHVWAKVDKSEQFDLTGLDPETTTFVIFHAGVGRDIELTGTSLDITPYDLPSIYLKEDQLIRLLDDSTFEGFPINDGAFHVKSSMIIPRTQSRRGEDIGGNEVVFPLSINGLLCASIGSHLGLPDLFNTADGSPAIGRFGLMDGAGFFSYNGLIPPEPSAWEKVALGWIEPVNITESAGALENQGSFGPFTLAPASMDRNADDPQLYRWDISSNEYFLIEYRNRDLNASGVELTIREPDGARVRQQFTNSDTDFIYQYAGFDTLLTAGTLLNVSNFDWSLPGGLDLGPDQKEGTEDDRELNGGLLIWHIDEGVIQRAFDAQAQGGDRGVNEDPYYRGVDLEEADGAQDIGLDAGLLDNSPSFGYAYDFWWENNNYHVITENGSIDLNPNNVFGPQTYPNNASNAGARQYFELFDIQATGSTAQFSIRYAAPDANAPALAANIQDFLTNGLFPVHSYYLSYPLSVGRVIVGPQGVAALGDEAGAPSDTLIVVQAEQSLHLLSLNQLKSKQTITAEDWIRLPEMVGPLQPVLQDRIITAERQANDSQLRIRSWNYIPGDDSLVQRWEQTIASELGSTGLGEQLGYLSSAGNVTGVGDAESSILVEYLGLQLDKTGQISASDWQLETALIEFQENGNNLAGSFQARWNEEQIQVDGWSAHEISALEQSGLLGSVERTQWIPVAQGSTVRLVQVSETEVGVFDPNAADVYTLIYSALPTEMVAQWPAISKKGQLFRVNSSENTIEGYYLSGAMLDYFPLPAPESVRWMGSPLLTDLNGDEEQELLLVGQNPYATLLYAYTLQGETLLGFPLSVGAGGFNSFDSGVDQGSGMHQASRIQIPGIVGSFVTAIAPSGELSIWEFPNMGNADWPSRMGPWGWNRAVQAGEDSGLSGGGDNEVVLVTTETYNWPNPAKDHTNVRFQTSGAGQVQIQIIDLSGQLIYEQQIQSRGGSPEEITIDTSQWPSGAYIALIKATVAGKTGSKLVKMAIAK
jgi:hypothetical protein